MKLIAEQTIRKFLVELDEDEASEHAYPVVTPRRVTHE